MRLRNGLVLAALSLAAIVETRPAEPAAPVPVVVELFTSEGCSSCPPADALLRDLLATQPVAGATVIGLSEHVDYWNQLGWRDPFSDARFSDRQHRYASTTSADTYTPQMIVDGATAFVGSDRAEALRAIGRAATRAKAPVTLAWTFHPVLRLDVTIARASANDDVLLAIAEDGLSSAVKSGENAGRTMAHAAVTRRLQSVGTVDRTGAFRASVPVTVDASWHTSALAAVVIVQQHGQGAIDGSAALRWPK